MSGNNVFFEWRKMERTPEGNTREHYLNIPVKVEKAVDDGWNIKANLICNKCESPVKQHYACISCGQENTMKEILKRKTKTFRKGVEVEIIYQEAQKKQFMEQEKPKLIRVVDEVDAQRLLKEMLRVNGDYEMYNNEKQVAPTINKIYGYLDRNQKALIVEYMGEGGILLAGKGELTLYSLRDTRQVRRPKQEGLTSPLDDAVTETLDSVSEDNTPLKMDKFLDLVLEGKKIEVPIEMEKPTIIVETSWLEA